MPPVHVENSSTSPSSASAGASVRASSGSAGSTSMTSCAPCGSSAITTTLLGSSTSPRRTDPEPRHDGGAPQRASPALVAADAAAARPSRVGWSYGAMRLLSHRQAVRVHAATRCRFRVQPPKLRRCTPELGPKTSGSPKRLLLGKRPRRPTCSWTGSAVMPTWAVPGPRCNTPATSRPSRPVARSVSLVRR